ncbi:MAG: NAD-dependent epimerase/dehydratase family protein, partial [Lentisphaeria bacterium]|nr:NAD-dependent epimerase/dehydratase family protein [Lentisphaeria bacterium]
IVIKGNGTPYRSYLHADDLVRWLFKAMFEGKPGRAYNIGSDRAVSILELAKTVRKVLHSQNEIVVCQKPVPGVKPPRYVPDISRIRNELNVKIETGLEESISKSV